MIALLFVGNFAIILRLLFFLLNIIHQFTCRVHTLFHEIDVSLCLVLSISDSTLSTGAGVVTTRAHVHYVVTEFGFTNLFGKNLRQRAFELIRIAHPDHREELEKAAFQRLHCMPSAN